MRTYTFRIENKKFEQLNLVAKKEERTISQLVRLAINELLKKYEGRQSGHKTGHSPRGLS